MLRSLCAFLLLLLLPPSTLPRTLLLEVSCFRSHVLFTTRQELSLCTSTCRHLSSDHSQPLGACASSDLLDNLEPRLRIDISNASNPPVLHVYAFSVWRKRIEVGRQKTVDAIFDLRSVKPWPESRPPPLPPSHELKATKWNTRGNLSIRAAWAYRINPETTTISTITTTRPPTTAPVVVALPPWILLASGFGLFSLLVCVVLLLYLYIRRRKKKKKRRANETHAPMHRVNESTARRSANVYDLRQSRIEGEEVYDALEYGNDMYENGGRAQYEDPAAILYEDPGTVYSMERQMNWNNDGYGRAPSLPLRMDTGSRTTRFTRK